MGRFLRDAGPGRKRGGAYLCSDPQSGGGEAEAGRGEEGRVGEVEGEEDHVPEEILRGREGC